jgi:hypothetical protein
MKLAMGWPYVAGLASVLLRAAGRDVRHAARTCQGSGQARRQAGAAGTALQHAASRATQSIGTSQRWAAILRAQIIRYRAAYAHDTRRCTAVQNGGYLSRAVMQR